MSVCTVFLVWTVISATGLFLQFPLSVVILANKLLRYEGLYSVVFINYMFGLVPFSYILGVYCANT